MASEPHSGTDCVTVDDLRNLKGELRLLAVRLLSKESNAHTFTPTGLAMTALRRVKLKDQDWDEVRWENRAHFFAAISLAMRNALVDHARRRRAKGRSNLVYLPPDEKLFDDLPGAAENQPEAVLEMHDALDRLRALDPRLDEVLQQHYFFGYSIPEMARFAEVSEKTVDRELKRARTLLKKVLEEGAAGGAGKGGGPLKPGP